MLSTFNINIWTQKICSASITSLHNLKIGYVVYFRHNFVVKLYRNKLNLLFSIAKQNNIINYFLQIYADFTAASKDDSPLVMPSFLQQFYDIRIGDSRYAINNKFKC